MEIVNRTHLDLISAALATKAALTSDTELLYSRLASLATRFLINGAFHRSLIRNLSFWEIWKTHSNIFVSILFKLLTGISSR